jgi:hypothetical protein
LEGEGEICYYFVPVTSDIRTKRTEKKKHIEKPNEWESDEEKQFQEALVKTKGIHNHFWLESSFVDLDGQVQKIDRIQEK